MDSPPESRDNTEMPPDPFNEHMDDIQAMINDYTNKEIVQELSQRGFQTLPKKPGKTPINLGLPATFWSPGG
jgi:hypothetical protein